MQETATRWWHCWAVRGEEEEGNTKEEKESQKEEDAQEEDSSEEKQQKAAAAPQPRVVTSLSQFLNTQLTAQVTDSWILMSSAFDGCCV